MTHYWIALGLTLLTELACLIAWLRLTRESSDTFAAVMFVLGLNMVTHPIAWFVFSSQPTHFWPVEIGVILAEAVCLALALKMPFAKSLLLSAAMNSASMAIGCLVFEIIS